MTKLYQKDNKLYIDVPQKKPPKYHTINATEETISILRELKKETNLTFNELLQIMLNFAYENIVIKSTGKNLKTSRKEDF